MEFDNHLQLLLVGFAESKQAESRQNAEKDRNWLFEPDGSWDSRAAKDNRGQETQFNAVRLPVLDAVAAKSVWPLS